MKQSPSGNGTWLRPLVWSVIRTFYVFNLQFSQNTAWERNNWYSLLQQNNAYVIKWWRVDFRSNTASTKIKKLTTNGTRKFLLESSSGLFQPNPHCTSKHLETTRKTCVSNECELVMVEVGFTLCWESVRECSQELCAAVGYTHNTSK